MTNAYFDALEAVNKAHTAIHDTTKVISEIAYAHRLLEWNRAQANPPIKIWMEYVVAKQAVIAGAAKIGVEE